MGFPAARLTPDKKPVGAVPDKLKGLVQYHTLPRLACLVTVKGVFSYNASKPACGKLSQCLARIHAFAGSGNGAVIAVMAYDVKGEALVGAYLAVVAVAFVKVS